MNPENIENVPKIHSEKSDLVKSHDLSIIEQVVMQGDLSRLNPEQRVTYYHRVCESIGLNPYTRPFDYISLNGKLTLYAKKDATEQLRDVKKISITGLEGKVIDDLYIVTARAKTSDGRTDEATGAVTIGHLKGDQKANAIMKAETKAKRRVTLSIAGLGWTDETEIEAIPSAVKVNVDLNTGEIEADVQRIKPNPTFQQLKASQNMNQEPKITDDQFQEMMKLYVQANDEFKINFEKYMLDKWSAKGFRDIPFRCYDACMTSIARNIEMQTMGVSNENH